MIQFNLLPDVKLEYIKSRRQKRLVIMIATVSASAALLILIALVGVVDGAQKKYIGDLNRDIKTNDTKLQQTKDLNKILTIQNQLNSLTALHEKKPAVSRLFDYLAELTPAQVSISKLSINLTTYTYSLTGSADALSTVNKFADTLKFTTYSLGAATTVQKKAFSSIVLQSFSRDTKTAQYSLNASFDPVIFDSKQVVKLSIPNIISTRSETEKPGALFNSTEDTK